MPAHQDTPYQNLITHLADTNDTKQIEKLFNALLTDKERIEIANRIRIFDLLEQGITQREIAQQLGVGVATVSRGVKAMQQHDIAPLLLSHRRP